VVGYKKLRLHTNEPLGMGSVDLPPYELFTTGYWIGIQPSTIQVLEAEGLWTATRNEYGPGWPAQRERVRQRDGYRCQMCGLPEQGRAHDVHHKVPFKSFSSSVEANQLNNLITLCPACHRRAENAVRVRSGLSGLAFTLGNLAPLFLMCDPRDLGVHADPLANYAGPEAEPAPWLVLYDQVPAGIGFSERLFEVHAELLNSARELVSTCPCSDGCPSCVGPGGENGYGGKPETLALLDALCESNST
jgi:DEAD/DEAH box helicase domain-containing protein